VGCLVVANRAFDRLTPAEQRALQAAAAKLGLRIEDAVRRQDQALLGGRLRALGVHVVPVTPAARARLTDLARAARERTGEKVVPRALLERVAQLVADYRAAAGPPH
jgi:TRAP-type C4-dicarboxylate transport system substrate-binding protein